MMPALFSSTSTARPPSSQRAAASRTLLRSARSRRSVSTRAPGTADLLFGFFFVVWLACVCQSETARACVVGRARAVSGEDSARVCVVGRARVRSGQNKTYCRRAAAAAARPSSRHASVTE